MDKYDLTVCSEDITVARSDWFITDHIVDHKMTY